MPWSSFVAVPAGVLAGLAAQGITRAIAKSAGADPRTADILGEIANGVTSTGVQQGIAAAMLDPATAATAPATGLGSTALGSVLYDSQGVFGDFVRALARGS